MVADGTNRIGDLEFRLCEMEKGCDTSALPVTQSLGGPATATAAGGDTVAPASDTTTGGTAPDTGVDLAMNEQSDFDKAKAKMDAGDFAGAAADFATFAQAYPGGPLTGDAQFLQGEALTKSGDTAGAARAYLASFSGAPEGPRAPASLVRLGAALGILGQTQDACVTLREVPTRFPQAPEAAEAQKAMQGLNCP